jgi:Skp family chaperone for outer membrane proteins
MHLYFYHTPAIAQNYHHEQITLMSIKIESDLKEVLTRLDQKFDRLDQKLDNLQKDVTDLKVELVTTKTELTGKINTLDERLTGKINTLDTKVEGISTRLQNQEFTSRAIFISLILVILGGAAKMFGFITPM